MDKNANAWIKYADEFNMNVDFSKELIHTGLGVPGMLPSDIVRSNITVIDIGCGNGMNTYLLAKHTTGRVVGIDPVESQIQTALTDFSRNNTEYICCEFQTLTKHVLDKFDLITFLGSIDYIKIDEEFFDTINRLTHVGSRCFVSKFHPFWTTLYGNDIEDELDGSYFNNEHEEMVRFGTSEFIRYHYTLSDFISRFSHHGWVLNEFFEPKPDMEHSAFAYNGYEHDKVLQTRLSRIPMTAVFELQKER